MRISDGLPGSTHDLTAASTHPVITVAQRTDVELLADKAYQGAGGSVVVPHKRRKLTKAQKVHTGWSTASVDQANVACHPEAWRILTKVRCCPQRVGTFAKAVLTLGLGPES